MRVQGNYSVNNSELVSNIHEKQVEKDFTKIFSEDGVSINESARNLAEAVHNKAADFHAMNFRPFREKWFQHCLRDDF